MRESSLFGAEIRLTALNSGRASCSRCHSSVVHPFLQRALARAGSLMSMCMRVGEGSQPFAHSTITPASGPPLYAASSIMCRRHGGGGGHEVGVGFGGWVREAAMLRESHCKRNGICMGEQKHGNERNLKHLGHIHAIFGPFSREWKLHTNANETWERDMPICAPIK